MSFDCRYLELVHPIWHRAHFKKNWIYISCITTWVFGITLKLVHHIPTSKVIKQKRSLYHTIKMFLNYYAPFVSTSKIMHLTKAFIKSYNEKAMPSIAGVY